MIGIQKDRLYLHRVLDRAELIRQIERHQIKRIVHLILFKNFQRELIRKISKFHHHKKKYIRLIKNKRRELQD
jgi:hypothetical protein